MQNLNWTSILIGVAILAFFILHLRHGGFGHGGSRGPGELGDLGRGGFGGSGHGHHGGHDRAHGSGQRNRSELSQPEAAIDPVSGAAIPTAGAITSVYQGVAYYFASKENRDRFEAAPGDYAGKTQGVPPGDSDSAERQRHRHGGC